MGNRSSRFHWLPAALNACCEPNPRASDLIAYSDIHHPIPKVSSRTSHIGPANIGPASATLAYLTIYNRNPPDSVFRLCRLVITHYNF